MRRYAPLVLLALVLAAPASATGPAERKQQVDRRLDRLHDRIAAAREREDRLRAQIEDATGDIRELEQQVGDVSARLAPLERDLELHQRRLEALGELVRLQTRRLRFLRRQYRVAVRRLELRIVEIYESGQVGTVDIVLGSSSFTELVDGVEFAQRIRDQDAAIAKAVGRSRAEVVVLRRRTRATRKRVAAATRVIEVRTEQVRALRDSLVAREDALSAARGQRQRTAAELREGLKQMLDEADALQQASADLAAKLQAAQRAAAPTAGGSTAPPSASGMIWPVSGPVVSPFGYRCLGGLCRMHEGIDIGVGYGTAIRAAAAGTVVYAGWEGGYGNLILVDHGDGLATAYAHQSSFAVGGGAQVAQGQVIGYVGCTGRCFGPHLHFEVRVSGSPVDPLGYL